VRYIIDAPNVFFGIRNDGTKQFLESLLGLTSPRIIEVPDPGMYVPPETHDYPEIETGKKNVLLSLNNEDEFGRFPDPAKKTRFLQALARAIERLARAFDLNLILCPHHFDDYTIMSQFIGFLAPKIVHQRTISTGLLAVPKTGYFYGRYAKADLAMSMRIHSLSPAIGLGVPVVPLTSQNRVSDFLGDIGLGDLAVDVFGDEAEEQIVAKASHALSHAADLRARVREALSLSRERTREMNRHIALLLKHS
jgi:polysaccharide pyruvyl transferase WcaK-like protein